MKSSVMAAWMLFVGAISSGCGFDASTPSGSEETGADALVAGSIALKETAIRKKVPVGHRGANPARGLDACVLDAAYFVIRGTAHDAAVNRILRGRIPSFDTCKEPQVFEQAVRALALDAKEGLLSVVEVETTSFSSGLHGEVAFEYKNVDLRSGHRLTLADFVVPTASAGLKKIVDRKIDVLAAVRPGSTAPPLTAEERESLAQAAEGLFFDAAAPGRAVDPKDIADFALAPGGLQIDLSNQLPSALMALDAVFTLTWEELEAEALLRTEADAVVRARAAELARRPGG